MQNLVNRFEANGIHLWTENGKIKYKASKEAMTPAVLAELKANKEALIKYLSEMSDDSKVAIVIRKSVNSALHIHAKYLNGITNSK